MFYQSDLRSVVIPTNVTTVGYSAFKRCSSLTTVTFEKESQLKTIGGDYYYGAFSDCTALTSIEIPASVETIGNTAFSDCSSLATVTFEKGSRLKTIGNNAYYRCTSLTSIEIPASVETIEKKAFMHCSSLATVTFEKGSQLKTIAGDSYDGAFSDCTALTSIEIPASVETIEATAFKRCSKLATVTFEKGSQLKTIGGGYSSSSHFGTYSDYYGAFSDCSSLTSIEIPASVETIEATAFKRCSKLTTITFEKGSQLKTIGGGYYSSYYHGAFSDCSSLTSIEIPASVETIEATAFSDCSKLATVTFEKGSQLKIIGGGYSSSYYYGAFLGCSSLTSIEIPASVETIEATAFKRCSKLTTVTFEKGSQLKIIGGGFDTNVGYRYIYGAFSELKNLMTVDMSACTQVEIIEECAFYNDPELRLFKVSTETPPTCENNAFVGINPYSVLKVPSGCANAYKAATGWKNFASITGLDE